MCGTPTALLMNCFLFVALKLSEFLFQVTQTNDYYLLKGCYKPATHSHTSNASAVALQANVHVALNVNFSFQTRPKERLEAEVGKIPGGGRGRTVVDLHSAICDVSTAVAKSFVK